jgi:hypothetical protein
VLEPNLATSELKLSPVSVVLRDNKTWLCFSPDFEFFRHKKTEGLLSKWISKLMVSRQLDTGKLTQSATYNIEQLFQKINESICGAVELGLDCKISNDQTIIEIASQLQTANAGFLAGIFDKMSSQLNTEHLLTVYYSFSLAYRRMYLERMLFKFN